MGGLAYFFEEEGIPTTQISLIRLHTETIRPPRALWVSFEMGRPIGPPNDPEFQTRVLSAALKLFEADEGPVLVDFPEDAPEAEGADIITACPVNFHQEAPLLTERDRLCAAFKKEVGAMRPWYDMAVQKKGRTTVGVSGLEMDVIVDFLCSFLGDAWPESPRDDLSLPYTLNLATDDLKAYYFEGITSQPGQASPSGKTVSNWFWGETIAGKILLAIKEACKQSQDGMMQVVGKILIVPTVQAHRRERVKT